MSTAYSYRLLADGSRFDICAHPDRESARRAALDRQSAANSGYLGTPYPYYVAHESCGEMRADALPTPADED